MWQSDTLTRCGQGTVSRVTSSKWRAHRYVPILFYPGPDPEKPFVHALDPDCDVARFRKSDRWSQVILRSRLKPGTHSCNLRCACDTDRSRSGTRWIASGPRTSLGEGDRLSFSHSFRLSYPRTTDDPRGSHGATPPIIAAAALWTHGNRLYRRVYLVYRDEDRGGSRSKRIR